MPTLKHKLSYEISARYEIKRHNLLYTLLRFKAGLYYQSKKCLREQTQC